MARFVELGHDIYDGMPGITVAGGDGRSLRCTARVRPFVGREAFVRYAEGRDLAALRLEEPIPPGCVIDARGRSPWQSVAPDEITWPERLDGRAVLFSFGWDAQGEREDHHAYRFLAAGTRLVGVDTINIDDGHAPKRPAHRELPANEAPIVENPRGLERLYGTAFRFYALPIKGRGAASMPVRAFAEILEGDADDGD